MTYRSLDDPYRWLKNLDDTGYSPYPGLVVANGLFFDGRWLFDAQRRFTGTDVVIGL